MIPTQGANFGLIERGDHDQLVEEKQRFDTLVFLNPVTIVRIAQELVESRADWVCDTWTLALDNDQGNTIDEEHNIRHHKGIPTGQIDPELIDGEEIIVLCKSRKSNATRRAGGLMKAPQRGPAMI